MEFSKIYFDMDGVLADFDRGVWELCGMDSSLQNGQQDAAYDDRMWEKIRKVDHFYDRLELMPGAKEMFDALWGKYGDRVEILTGVPKPKRGILTAGEDKIAWVRRNLSPDVRVNIVLRAEKIQYCTGPETVLIDDLERTVREWQEKGGTGILYVSAEITLRTLREKEKASDAASGMTIEQARDIEKVHNAMLGIVKEAARKNQENRRR